MSATGDAMLDRVATFLNEVGGGPFGVAVSGGGDSMALLDLMHCHGGDIRAVTVDHGLRPEAGDEAAMVARFCAERGIPHDILKWQGWDRSGNLQAQARAARYGLIAKWARTAGVQGVALGHNLDDQAETFLMRLGRRAGTDGLRHMPERFERYGMVWLRPLMGFRRQELRDYGEGRGVPWVDDPSNEDGAFDRVRARQALAALAPLGVGARDLAEVARYLGAENDLIRNVLTEQLNGRVRQRFGALTIRQGDYAALHPELRRRFLSSAIRWLTGAGYGPRQSGLYMFDASALTGNTRSLAGTMVRLRREWLWLFREPGAVEGHFEGGDFDGRWHLGDWPAGGAPGMLGPDGLMENWRDLGVPREVLMTLPGLWHGDELRDFPDLSVDNPEKMAKSGAKLRYIRPSFIEWVAKD